MKLLLTLMVPFLLHCSHLTLHRSDTSKDVAPTSQGSYWIHSIVFGWVSLSQARPQSEMCPGAKVNRLETHMNAGQVALTVLTLGLYAPHEIEYECAKL